MQMRCLSSGIYSLKNCHKPFGIGFQHPLTAKFCMNAHRFFVGLPWLPPLEFNGPLACYVASSNLLKVALYYWQQKMLVTYSRSTVSCFWWQVTHIALCYLTLTVVRLMLHLLHLLRFLFSNSSRLKPCLGFRMNKRVTLKVAVGLWDCGYIK